MKINITRVKFGMTVSLPNYENIRFELEADVPPETNWKSVYRSLQIKSEKLKAELKQSTE
jgi:hypothetical protein